MSAFEIRILKENRNPSLILPGPHVSVLEALGTARRLAKEGDILEVWRDSDRVHHEQLTRFKSAEPLNDR